MLNWLVRFLCLRLQHIEPWVLVFGPPTFYTYTLQFFIEGFLKRTSACVEYYLSKYAFQVRVRQLINSLGRLKKTVWTPGIPSHRKIKGHMEKTRPWFINSYSIWKVFKVLEFPIFPLLKNHDGIVP